MSPTQFCAYAPLTMLNLCNWLLLKELLETADSQLKLMVEEARSQSLTTAQSAELDADPYLKKLTSSGARHPC